MRRSKWFIGLMVTALSASGCGQDVSSSQGEGPGSVMKAPLLAEWAVGVAYAVGAQVTYGGRLYQCRQPHTSQADWTPPAVAALWLDLGPSGGGDTTAPAVTLNASATNITAPGSLTLTATATDNVGVSRVELLENGTVVSTGNSYTRSFSGSAQNGTYTYVFRAFDAAGNVGTQQVSVTVAITIPGDTTAPTVTLNASTTNITAPGSVTLTATATDNVGVTRVELLENGTVVSTGNSFTRSFSSSGQNGSYNYVFRAFDAAGNVGTREVPVTVAIPGGNPSKRIVGYFTQWGIYGRNYQVAHIPAAKLTHINYAFSNISADGRCVLGDVFADIDKGGGWAGEWDPGQLRGNFRAFKELKRTQTHLKVLISVGGWTWSKYFSQVAASAASRTAFVKSCVDLFIKGQYPGVDPVNGAGVFDGIDIDWEYPVGGGLPGNTNNPADKQNYTLLMAEFRSQLNAVTTQTGKPYLLTIATGASPDLLANKQETKNLSNILDWINVMSYDYHGAFESTVNFHSALNRVTGDPMANTGFYTDGSVAKMLELGVAPNKIVVGVPFYGRGWGGVPNVNNGLFQSGVPTRGTWDDGQSGLTGVFDYKDVKANYERAGSGYTKFTHPEAKQAYVYSPSTGVWIAYDDPQTLHAKSDYILSKNLGGAMFWELSGDDGTLVDVLYQRLH
ncbi:glycosyl hydrolase [Myxococcus sp. CA051A]|uniref:glycosyl hydrolase family 18 protein n=1 Tax=unclassified Myxococcus TaxID=2648731 RepID=UPI00157B9B7A|nr:MULTISPECIES: glycosyl hydrolase family 18 protein [unclassified Myxococcus]NTX34387.1 glycosyl hydrolase [Myxococcus sp. CA033]NTX60785.1 glycosyl hydrolase [Myxococcus sp. CA051A]